MLELDSVFVVFPVTVVFETPVVIFPVNDWVLLESVKLSLVWLRKDSANAPPTLDAIMHIMSTSANNAFRLIISPPMSRLLNPLIMSSTIVNFYISKYYGLKKVSEQS